MKGSKCMFLSCHVRTSEWIHTLYFPELLTRNRRDIWSLSDCSRTRTHNHLIRKRTLNHLVKLAKWLSCVVSTYLYGAFDCMFLSCHARTSEWIHTLYFPECQGTPYSKQAWYLKFKWLYQDSNRQQPTLLSKNFGRYKFWTLERSENNNVQNFLHPKI